MNGRIPDLAVTCSCGHCADAEEFWRSPMGLPLPSGHYQCPSCGRAWTLKPVGRPEMRPSLIPGREPLYIPPKVEIVDVPRTL